MHDFLFGLARWLGVGTLLLALAAATPAAAARAAHPANARHKAHPAASPLPVPGDAAALGGYNLLIADRGNNRLLVLTPDKRIVWQYDFQGLPPGSGADDAFFADGGKTVIVNLEHSAVIQLIDYATKKVTWQYGEIGRPGSKNGRLNYPDDAYKLPNGNVMVADIRNCRIVEIAPDKRIVRQAGVTGVCGFKPPLLASPNGDTPLANGHVLVSTITDHMLRELDQNWKEIFKLKLPLKYPSDPQLTKAGNFLIADYSRPGRIIEVARDGTLVWDYKAEGEGGLARPSLALELPNGNVMANDDFNHRVIVIDKATKKILWQYGYTGKPGRDPGYLSIPDGLDIIKAD
ncbi:MAG: hypothetical protein HY245_14200 [Rhizobiales bacterium]|nr:hypothetical protein [Hyphomicrobiales bacterium]MBI3674544.1 hypothetical protein [Hyphomicrobiales bacterium]